MTSWNKEVAKKKKEMSNKISQFLAPSKQLTCKVFPDARALTLITLVRISYGNNKTDLHPGNSH